MGNRPWSEESVHLKPVGQQYMSHSNFPYPVHHQNSYLFPGQPPNGQFYTPSISQGTAYGYAAPYNADPYRDGHPTSVAMGRPPTYSGQDSAYYTHLSTHEWR